MSSSIILYVDELIGADTVNTLPPNTITACADHCDIASRIEQNVDQAEITIASLSEVDINLAQVMDELLDEGITKFIQPFNALMASLEEKVNRLSPV